MNMKMKLYMMANLMWKLIASQMLRRKKRRKKVGKSRKEWAMVERVMKVKYQCRKADVATRKPYLIKERRIRR